MLITVLAFVFLSFVGCTGMNNQNQQPGQTGENLMDKNQPNTPGDVAGPEQINQNLGKRNQQADRLDTPDMMENPTIMDGQQTGDRNDKMRSEKITNELKQMNQIQDANAIVSGDTCIVGFIPETNAGQAQEIKHRIEARVKEIDPTIKKVAASESQDIMQQINQLASEIGNAEPVKDVANEVKKIWDRIMPQGQ